MALTNIVNGQVPDATPLMANFNYLLGLIGGGQAIMADTYANLQAHAAENPTAPFSCIATDLDAIMVYCGKSDRGPNADGFITIATFGAIV